MEFHCVNSSSTKCSRVSPTILPQCRTTKITRREWRRVTLILCCRANAIPARVHRLVLWRSRLLVKSKRICAGVVPRVNTTFGYGLS